MTLHEELEIQISSSVLGSRASVSFHGYGWYLFKISLDGLHRATGISHRCNQDVGDGGKLLITGVDEI